MSELILDNDDEIPKSPENKETLSDSSFSDDLGEPNSNCYDSDDTDYDDSDEIEDTSDFRQNAAYFDDFLYIKKFNKVRDLVYDGTCCNIVEELLKLDGELTTLKSDKALFIPISIFEEFKEDILNLRISFSDEHVWDYDLQIGDIIEPMKLIWIVGRSRKSIRIHRNVKDAFSFLQPNYLRYLNKPFWNLDAITQVNLMLDYHRTQKRRHGIEIFSIFDLVAFKMAIDDNRFEYENCEFHKIIDRTLDELVQIELYRRPDGKFDLKEYLGGRYEYHVYNEIFDYLVYHFQNKIGSIYWNQLEPFPVKLSEIRNISRFLNLSTPKLLVRETDPNGRCSEVLYKILSKCTRHISIEFNLDGEWIYSGDVFSNNNRTEPLADIWITIDTKNSFNFIENFLNWLKFTFGKHTKYITLLIRNFEMIKPYIFNGLRLSDLQILPMQLDCNIIRVLQKCKHRSMLISLCRIANDHMERIEFIGNQSKNGQNIFKFLDELPSVWQIELELEEHTLGILLAFVESVITENKLIEFQFTNKIIIICGDNHEPFRFCRSILNADFEQIDILASSGTRIDLYELANNLQPIDREEFDFYN